MAPRSQPQSGLSELRRRRRVGTPENERRLVQGRDGDVITLLGAVRELRGNLHR
jgi:hypothetical protein